MCGIIAVDTIHKVAATLYHSLVHQLLEWFVGAGIAAVEEKFVPESGVDKVAGGVLCTAHIQIYVLPVLVCLFAHQCLAVVRIHIAQVVDAGASKARHGAEL